MTGSINRQGMIDRIIARNECQADTLVPSLLLQLSDATLSWLDSHPSITTAVGTYDSRSLIPTRDIPIVNSIVRELIPFTRTPFWGDVTERFVTDTLVVETNGAARRTLIREPEEAEVDAQSEEAEEDRNDNDAVWADGMPFDEVIAGLTSIREDMRENRKRLEQSTARAILALERIDVSVDRLAEPTAEDEEIGWQWIVVAGLLAAGILAIGIIIGFALGDALAA